MKAKTRLILAIFLLSAIVLHDLSCFSKTKSEKMKPMEEEGMEQPIYNYVEGWYEKDPNLLKQRIHPDLIKRSLSEEDENGIRTINLETLISLVPLYGGQGGSERIIDIKLMDADKSMAFAKLVSNSYVDYIHLGKWNNRWWIINVLWDFKNENNENFDKKNIAAIEEIIHDYLEGWYNKDAERMMQSLHPDLVKRSMNPGKSNGIEQYTRSSFLDLVPLYGGPNGNNRMIDIDILDIQNNIAAVKVTSNNYIDYIQLCYWQGKWWILNILWCNK